MTRQSNGPPPSLDGTPPSRRFGDPIELLQHFMGNLGNYDPAITDGLVRR